MATFKLYLVGNPAPLLIDLPAANTAELADLAGKARFIEGSLSEPDNDGVCAGVLVPTCRIHLAVEHG